MRRKILIIGAGLLQIPAIVKAKELGLNVAALDMSPIAPGKKFADNFYEVSTNDIKGVINAALDFRPDGVMTLATDMPMKSVAAVSERLHLNSISSEVAEKATDKIKMIQCFQSNNVPHPWFSVISTLKELQFLANKKGTPFIMKPNDSSGSNGVTLVNQQEEIVQSYHYCKSASKSGFVLVEEYMQGPEVSVEVMRINGKSHILAVTDKLTTGAPHFVEMGHSQPSQLSKNIIEQIKVVAIKAVEAIGIDNSPAHVEIIVTKKGPKMVELGARMGGDCISTFLVPLSTGIDMVKASIFLALGELPDVEQTLNQGAAIRYVKSEKGIISSIDGINKIRENKRIKHFEVLKKVGEEITSIHWSGDRIGYVVAQNDSAKAAIEDCEQALKELKIIVTHSKQLE